MKYFLAVVVAGIFSVAVIIYSVNFSLSTNPKMNEDLIAINTTTDGKIQYVFTNHTEPFSDSKMTREIGPSTEKVFNDYKLG